MESTTESTSINFLPHPNIDIKHLKYINKTKEVYANLYEIKINKELKLYQYPYSIVPEIEAGDLMMRQKIFKNRKVSLILKSIYGECFFSGDSLYGMKKINEEKKIDKIRIKGANTYDINLGKFTQERVIKQEDIHKDELAKNFIEILIRDILHSNPNLEFDKGLFYIKNQVQEIKTERVNISFYPGYTTSFMETEGGNFLNVTIKNKIVSNENILEFLNKNNYHDKRNRENIKKLLIGRSFKVVYAQRNYIIDDISFEKNPLNQTINYNGQTINLLNYYQNVHGLTIKDRNQPLVLVKGKGPQNKTLDLYFIPEFSSLAGLDEGAIKDRDFMKILANYTKLKPEDRIEKTNEFLDLLTDPTKDPENKEKLSAKEKSALYGIEVTQLNKLFTAYYMEETKLVGGKNKSVKTNDRVFPVFDTSDMTKWVCFYEKANYDDAANLFYTLEKASKGFGFRIKEPEWVEMPNRSKINDWLDTASEYVGNGKDDYAFAVFLLGKFNDNLYAPLKKHSLCENGYVSQIVRTKSLQKNSMSVCSKILLQINAKLQGASYITKIDPDVKERELMIIGIDSSHIRGQKTGVALVATINESFTNFYNKELIIENDKIDSIKENITEFIDEASFAYIKKNNPPPRGIIIFRQGVSFHQKEFLKAEIKNIDSKCKEKNLTYYYILVNTKTTYKFFEKSRRGYSNPFAGLLILDGITNRNLFEFYIQPQEVTGGSATPTCFHVAYGNMDYPEMLPKLTYDLCHIYSNWQGPVRVPNVIKAAEKLSKMTAKYTLEELHESLSQGQAYL